MLLDSFSQAAAMIVSLDREVLEYTCRSLSITAAATLAAGSLGVPAGLIIAEYDFPGKRVLITILNTLLGIPTVVIGLTVYLILSRHGLLGEWHLLFTVPGIIIGETLLILPLITTLTLSAAGRTQREIRQTARALGADTRQLLWTITVESRFGILTAVIAAFGRAISEVGIAMIVGGNADRFTRTLTTAVVLNVDMGNFAQALALGIILLAIALLVNILFQLVQGKVAE